jgi:hypothetical protein
MKPVTEADVAHALSAFGAPEIPYRSFNNVLTPAEPGAAPPVSAEAYPLLADSLPGAAERLGARAAGMGAPPEPAPMPPPMLPLMPPPGPVPIADFQPRPAPTWVPVEHRLAEPARPRRISLAEMFRVLAGGAPPPPASAAELHDMFRRLA